MESQYARVYSQYLHLFTVYLQYSECLFILKIGRPTDPADDHYHVMVTTADNMALGY